MLAEVSLGIVLTVVSAYLANPKAEIHMSDCSAHDGRIKVNMKMKACREDL
jgi:hypothetical protein